MEQSPPKPVSEKPKGDAPQRREDRLKRALLANMAKRKAQTKARGAAGADLGATDNEQQQGE